MSKRLEGLYLVTPELSVQEQDDEIYLRDIADVLSGGAMLLQFRDKSADPVRRKKIAIALREICRVHDVLLLINDDVDLAAEVGAHGVHLGEQDRSVESARRQLGDQAIIGVSCYNRLALAQSAEAEGADYVAFGRFFPSRSKPLAVQAPVSLLTSAQQFLSVPLAAIGGITVDNAAQLIKAGADMVAVIEGVFGQQDKRGAARVIANYFSPDAN